MMMKIKINVCGIILWSLAAYTIPSFSATNTKEQLIDKVIVSVDDQLIFYTDVESEYTFYTAQREKLKEVPSKLQIVENLIINKILLATAIKKGIYIKKEEIEKNLQARLESIIHQMGGVARLEQHFAKSIEEIKQDLRKNINEQLTIERMRHKILEDVTLMPQEVKHFYEQIPASELPSFPTMVEAYRIMQYPTMADQSKQKLEAVRAGIVQQGKAFSEVSKTISEDIATVANGEEGCYKRGELDPLYEETALRLSPGQVSEVIETEAGFYLIQLIKKNKKQYNTRHLFLKHHPHKQAIEELMQEMQRLHQDIINKKITFDKAVDTYSMDEEAIKQQHGLFTDHEERITALENLNTSIIPIITKMQSGEIATPCICTGETGEQAVAIIYVKELIPAHRANLEYNYDYFLQLALVQKKQQALEKWLEESTPKVIFKFDPAYELSQALQKKYSTP
jgi:peptidyl-prolyl cis-trans isomerase SurA